LSLLLAVPKIYVEKQLRESLKLALQDGIAVFARGAAFSILECAVRSGCGVVRLILHEAEYPPKRREVKGNVNCMEVNFQVCGMRAYAS